MTKRVRSGSVRTSDQGELFEVDRGTFDRLLADIVELPEFAPTMQMLVELQELPCFSHLAPDQLKELLDEGEWVNIGPGTTIVEQGDLGDTFYVIGSGQVEVIRDGSALRRMGPGTFFGELALLLDSPRTATVRAVTPVRVFRLDRAGFDRLIGDAFRRGKLRPHAGVDRTLLH
jgi:cAMP-dependent protein kinase regulator